MLMAEFGLTSDKLIAASLRGTDRGETIGGQKTDMVVIRGNLGPVVRN